MFSVKKLFSKENVQELVSHPEVNDAVRGIVVEEMSRVGRGKPDKAAPVPMDAAAGVAVSEEAILETMDDPEEKTHELPDVVAAPHKVTDEDYARALEANKQLLEETRAVNDSLNAQTLLRVQNTAFAAETKRRTDLIMVGRNPDDGEPEHESRGQPVRGLSRFPDDIDDVDSEEEVIVEVSQHDARSMAEEVPIRKGLRSIPPVAAHLILTLDNNRDWVAVGATVVASIAAAAVIIRNRFNRREEEAATMEKEAATWDTAEFRVKLSKMPVVDQTIHRQRVQKLATELARHRNLIDPVEWRRGLGDSMETLLLLAAQIPMAFMTPNRSSGAWLSRALRVMGMVRAFIGDDKFLKRFAMAYGVANMLRWPDAIRVPISGDYSQGLVDWFESETKVDLVPIRGATAPPFNAKRAVVSHFVRLDRVLTDIVMLSSIFNFVLNYAPTAREPSRDPKPKPDGALEAKAPAAPAGPVQGPLAPALKLMQRNDASQRKGCSHGKHIVVEGKRYCDYGQSLELCPCALESLPAVALNVATAAAGEVLVATGVGVSVGLTAAAAALTARWVWNRFNKKQQPDDRVDLLLAHCELCGEDLESRKKAASTRASKDVLLTWRGYKIYADEDYKIEYPLGTGIRNMKAPDLVAYLLHLDDEYGWANIGTAMLHSQTSQDQHKPAAFHANLKRNAAAEQEQKHLNMDTPSAHDKRINRAAGERERHVDEPDDVDVGNRRAGANFGRVTRFDTDGEEKQSRDRKKKGRDSGTESWFWPTTNAFDVLREERDSSPKGCIHGLACPLNKTGRVIADPYKACNLYCGGHQCHHWAGCKPESTMESGVGGHTLTAPPPPPPKKYKQESMGSGEKNLAAPKSAEEIDVDKLKALRRKQTASGMEAQAAYDQTRSIIIKSCAYCKADGHHIKECPRLKCHKCGKQGHRQKDCVPVLLDDVKMESANGNIRSNPEWAKRALRVYRDAAKRDFVCFTGIYRGLLWMVAHEDPKTLWLQAPNGGMHSLAPLEWVEFEANHMWLAEAPPQMLFVKQWAIARKPAVGEWVSVTDDLGGVTQRQAGERLRIIEGASLLMSYDASTEKGDCGQAVVNLSVTGGGTLAGIHIADRHFALFPSVDALAEAFPDSKNFKAPVISAPSSPRQPKDGAQK